MEASAAPLGQLLPRVDIRAPSRARRTCFRLDRSRARLASCRRGSWARQSRRPRARGSSVRCAGATRARGSRDRVRARSAALDRRRRRGSARSRGGARLSPRGPCRAGPDVAGGSAVLDPDSGAAFGSRASARRDRDVVRGRRSGARAARRGSSAGGGRRPGACGGHPHARGDRPRDGGGRRRHPRDRPPCARACAGRSRYRASAAARDDPGRRGERGAAGAAETGRGRAGARASDGQRGVPGRDSRSGVDLARRVWRGAPSLRSGAAGRADVGVTRSDAVLAGVPIRPRVSARPVSGRVRERPRIDPDRRGDAAAQRALVLPGDAGPCGGGDRPRGGLP